MFKITRIRVTDEDGGLVKACHCDIQTDNLELSRSELRRQYEKEFGRRVKISLNYNDGESDEQRDSDE